MISKESCLIYFSPFATFLVWPVWLVNLEMYKTICFTVDFVLSLRGNKPHKQMQFTMSFLLEYMYLQPSEQTQSIL